MKKILSLLVLLVTTLSAFALDFTDYRKVTLGSYTPTESNDAKLSVTDNGDGTYNVTFNDIINKDGSYTDNYGTFTFSNVSGSKSGDVTTVTATDVTGTVSGGTYNITEFTKGNLSLKFKDGKAYATMTATCRVFYSNHTFDVVFGTDEGFGGGSTGGGETGGETSSIVTVKENFQSTEGSSWGENVTIDWNTQKLVASINLASTGSDKGFLGVTKKGQTAGWNNDGIIFYNTNGSTIQGYAPGQPNNANTNQVTKGEDPVRFEISKDGGVKCQGNVVISASNIAHLTNQSEIVVGAADKPAGALYNYIKVVPLGWTEPVTPPSVKEEKTFNEALYMVQGTTPLKIADSKVVVKEMTDETINMSLTYTIGDSNVEYTSTELTKGTDAKGRTTYTGKVAKDAMTFDVAGVVYEKDNVSRLYMTMTATNMNIVVGENPDTEVQKPVVYKNTLKVVRGTDTQTYEDAEVSVLAKGEGMYEVTLPKFSDMDNVPGELGPITFQAKGVEENGKVVLTATDQEFTLTNTGWKNDVVKVSMKGEIESEMLKATFNVNHSSMSGYNYTLYYGVEAPEVVTEESNKTYKSNLRIADQTSEDENAYLFQPDEATVNIIKYSDKTYKITLKQITLNSKTSDLVFTGKAVESEVDPGEGGVVETEGTMVQATADADTQNFLGGAVNAQFMWQDISDTEIRMSFVLEGKTLSLGGEFNYEKKDPDTPDPELFSKENYVADGTGFEWDINVDWDTQKIVMSIDPSTCTGSCEDVIGLGAVPTAWDNTLHLYRTSADQMLQGYFQTSAGNNNTGKFAETAPFLVEVSKAQGFVVNNEVKIAASEMSYLFTLPTVKMGTGEGANDKSRATYNYVKVVDKDWTAPKDPDTGINATTVAEGEVEFFTVNGVKLNKLQKGLNIVRTADGKVKKVLVK